MNSKRIFISEFGFIKSLIIFGSASIVLIAETNFLIPYLSNITGLEPIVFWLLVSALGLFFPMLLAAAMLAKREGHKIDHGFWRERLRFKKITKQDLIFSVVGIISAGLLCGLVMYLLRIFSGEVNLRPSFMVFEPLTVSRYWILLIWLPSWILNIMGEEIFWRGIILPGQELVFGKYTWILHGFFWLIFHFGFGINLLMILTPYLFIHSYIVYRQKNSWTGVIMHAVINGPSFLAIAFGFI